MAADGNLNGESRSRRTARPYVLAVVALAVLIAIVVAIAKPRETREGAATPVVGADPGVAGAASTAAPASPAMSPSQAQPSGAGAGTREMPDGGPPLDSTAPPKG